MKVIKNCDSRVTKIINIKKLKDDTQYRLSRYIFPYSYDGRFLIAHMLSNEVIELSECEWNAFNAISTSGVRCGYLRENGLEALALSRYIVESDYDEVKQYKQLVFLLKTISGAKKGLNAYTILPTTGCNARCVYCYEEGYVIKTMTSETADRLIDFICENRSSDTVKLTWFGGEPLANVEAIRRICSGLREHGVQFKSNMITNASLVTKELAHEAKELWNLNKVQVSLDGAREDYDERKRYVSPQKYNYDAVLRSIGYLVDEGFKVLLRCNYDKDNLVGLKNMVDDIAERFGGKENLRLYFHILFQQNDKEDYADQLRAIDDVCAYAESLGLLREGALRSSFRTNYCMADNMENSIVVAPDGALYSCEHLPEGGTWGNLFDGIKDEVKYNELKSEKPLEKECAECSFLPFCTSFRKKNCPDIPKYCRSEKQIEIERHLRSLIRHGNTETENEDEKLQDC